MEVLDESPISATLTLALGTGIKFLYLTHWLIDADICLPEQCLRPCTIHAYHFAFA